MAQLDESRNLLDTATEHVTDHNELHRKTNRIQVQEQTGESDSLILGDPSVAAAVASDLYAALIAVTGQTNYENIIGGDGSTTVNTTTPNETKAGTNANYSAILAGYDNVIGAIAGIIAAQHSYIAEGATHGTILGGSVQKILAGDYAAIVGGNLNTVTDGDQAAAIGGNQNTVDGNCAVAVGGQTNTIDGNYGAILGGLSNEVNALVSSIGGGRDNVANAEYSTIPGGRDNETATAAVHGIATGKDAKATIRAAHTHASGKIAVAGDAQTSVIVARRQTTNNTSTDLRPEDFYRLTIPTDTTWAFRALIAARRTDADGESAAYELVGCIDNNAGTTALVGSVTKTVIAEDTAAWDVSATADNTNDALGIYVTGENSKTINWVARVELAEVTG